MPKEAKARAAKGEGKAKKDKSGPKRPLSAYMYFSKAERDNVKSENPGVSFGEIGKLLGQKWKELSAEEKKPYEAEAETDKKRYQDEVAAGGGEVKAPKAKKAKKPADDDEDDEVADDAEDE